MYPCHLLRPKWALGAEHLHLGSGEGVLNGQGLTVQCSFGGMGKRGTNSFLNISDNH